MKKRDKKKRTSWKNALFNCVGFIVFPVIFCIAAVGSGTFLSKILGISPVIDSWIYKLQAVINSHSDIFFFVIAVMSLIYMLVYFTTHLSLDSISVKVKETEDRFEREFSAANAEIEKSQIIIDETKKEVTEDKSEARENTVRVSNAVGSTISDIKQIRVNINLISRELKNTSVAELRDITKEDNTEYSL